MTEIEISAGQARELTDRIKVGVEAIWELVKQAFQSRAWAALGYDSWDDYCTREFGTSRIRLPREERQEVVASMREIGMSVRAIAAATGSGTRTIQRDLQAGVANDHTSTPAPITGTDGKTYTPKPRPEPEEEPAPPEWEDVGTIPQSRLKDIARPTAIPQSELDELNNPPEPPMATPAKSKGDKTSNYLTEAAERINLMLETLSSIDFTNTTDEAKAAALENLEQATRHLTTIKRNIK